MHLPENTLLTLDLGSKSHKSLYIKLEVAMSIVLGGDAFT